MTLRFAGLVAGAGAVVLVVVLLFFGSGSGTYQVNVNLPDADGLRPGSRVEIGGVQVGNVGDFRITPQDHALGTITLKQVDAPIGTDASVIIRPADLLGEKYLDLSVGNRAHPARQGFTIPASHTQDAANLDQVLNVLGPTTRDRLAILIHETGVALFGRGTDLKSVLGSLPPSVTDAKALIRQVSASNANLRGLLIHSGHVLQTISAERQRLGGFVNTAAGAFTATAAKQRQLAATVAQAPGTLLSLRTTLQRLDVAGAALRPAAAGLLSTAPGLTATLKALPGFTTASLPTLREVRTVSPDLTRLGRQASPVIARLRPTAVALQKLSNQANPFTNALDVSAADFLAVLQNWARAIQTHDGLSHEFRVSVEITPTLIKSLLPVIKGLVPLHKGKGTPTTSAISTISRTPPASAGTATPTATPIASVSSATAPITKSVKGLLGYLLGR